MGSELEQLALHLQSEKDLMAALENDLKHKDEAISKKYNDVSSLIFSKKFDSDDDNFETQKRNIAKN